MIRNHLIKALGPIAMILSIVACSLPFGGPDTSGTATSQAVRDIPYCDTDSSVLCLISFGVDNKGQMFINFYKPQLSIRDFYLRVRYNQTENMYECETVKDFEKHISCTGERIPLEEQIIIGVYLTDDNTLIAKGTFVISAFAIATPVLGSTLEGTPSPASSLTTSEPATATRTRTRTPQVTATRTSGTPNITRTVTPGTGTSPTPTRTRTKTPTPTVSYPNP